MTWPTVLGGGDMGSPRFQIEFVSIWGSTSPSSPRRLGERPGSVCPGPMPQNQAWACGPGHTGWSRHLTGLSRHMTPRWQTRTSFLGVGGGRVEVWRVMWHICSTQFVFTSYLANLKTWCTRWNYLADIYVTNVGAIFTTKAILARWHKKSILPKWHAAM